MFLFDQASEERLAVINPVLVVKVRAAGEQCELNKVYFRVAQGLRTFEEQNELFAQGRTKPGKQVTKAPGGYSNHNFGCAVDCYPFLGDEPEGDLEMVNVKNPKFVAMVDALKGQGLVWGGDWIHEIDYPHFQLADFPVTPTPAIRSVYATKGLIGVWDMYKD